MARSDLLISLVRAGSSGDFRNVRAAAEAIIAEEKAKKHNILADRLTEAMHVNGNGHSPKDARHLEPECSEASRVSA